MIGICLRKTIVALLALACLASSQAQARSAAPLRLLFLGDRGHHRPIERFRQLQPALASRGIELSYTEDMNVLRPDVLAKYQGLVLYANIDQIDDAQAKALLDYVAGGGGFIPLHCASYCFRNNDEVVALIGGQFKRHGKGVIRIAPEGQAAEHPLMRGYHGFESWDETYVHTKHNEQDRTVLEYRVDGAEREPWTWIRTHGKGRVFYTAWGHDERTWSNPGFVNLVERGIRWACGDDPSVVPVFADRPAMKPKRTDVKPLEYVEAELPFYAPGGNRTGNDRPVSRMQKPLTAEESLKHYITPIDFHVELFAAEPQIGKVVAMNWDERGRLWACETVDYPNELQPQGQGHDRIRICEDTDGDGRADRFTVFAEHLSIPTAIACIRGGAVVQDGVETVFLKDTDGDDRADVRHVLITGWGLGDTHGGVSNFQYGLDDWIWAMQGYNNSTPKFPGSKDESFRAGFFRFRLTASDPPEVAELEFIRSTNNNTWGLGISEEGLIFGSTANGNPSEYMPIANRYYEAVRGWSPETLNGIAESNTFEPVTDAVRQVDHHGGFTAAAGHALYTARQWPQEYWNRTAFVTEPTGHLVATFQLNGSGASFRSHNAYNILAGDDEWIAPIMAEIGPDGQLWVADWYNIIVQHNPTPVGYKTGKGKAYEIPLRDKTHGRVYRVVYDKSAASTAPKTLHGATNAELVAALRCDNFLWRRHAQRLLIERRATDVVEPLWKLVEDQAVDAAGLNVGAIHALHVLASLNQLTPENFRQLEPALRHPSAGVRRNAVQLAPRTVEATSAIVHSAKLLDDADGQVRLAVLLALAESPPSADAAEAVARFAADAQAMSDHWLSDAATAAAARQADFFLRTIFAKTVSAESRGTVPTPLIEIVAEHYARGAPSGIGTLMSAVTDADYATHAATVDAVLAGLARGWPKQKPAKMPGDVEARLSKFLRSLSPAAKGSLMTLAASWDLSTLAAQIAKIAGDFLKVAADERAADEARVDAVARFVSLRSTDEAAAPEVLKLISARTSPDAARGFLEALAESSSPATAKALLDRYDSFTPPLRTAALRVLLARADWTAALVAALDEGRIPPADLALDQKQSLAAYPDRAIVARVKKVFARGGGLPNPDRQKVLNELLPLAVRSGDVALGKEVFKKQCSKCHMHSGEGNRIGPDLTGMAVHPKKELLMHLIDPSRNVEGNFRVYTVALADGRVMTGLLAGESKTTLEIIDSEAKRHVLQRADVEELVASTKSLMPEGFEKQVPPDDIVNLLEFLTARGRYVPIPLDKAATAVSTLGLFHNRDSMVDRMIFDDWKPKTFEGVPFVLVDPQGDRVPNVVLLNSPNGRLPPTMPKSVSLSCNAPAKAVHLLSGVGGWSFPASSAGSVSMIVRLHYADGSTEDHPLVNGRHFADYIRRVDVPESKFAFALRSQQLRYLAVYPKRSDKINTIELVKGNDRSSPIVMAVTVESP
ncbi:MAG TPA: PVC-type heme-binding CxxCH protein [Pirellulales bacterium]|nr:PVC-type heme-binding CxxCH protein [Pirellulales bacterium]